MGPEIDKPHPQEDTIRAMIIYIYIYIYIWVRRENIPGRRKDHIPGRRKEHLPGRRDEHLPRAASPAVNDLSDLIKDQVGVLCEHPTDGLCQLFV